MGTKSPGPQTTRRNVKIKKAGRQDYGRKKGGVMIIY